MLVEETVEKTEAPVTRVVKIEAKRAKDIWDEWHYGPEEYSWAEDYPYGDTSETEVERMEREEFEKAIGGPLDYEPFDVYNQLRDIRQEHRKEKDLSLEVRREHRVSKMVQIRKERENQTLGIAQTIRDLYNEIQNNPEASAEDLIQLVRSKAPEFRFSKSHLLNFRNGINRYVEKHKAVEKFRKLFPDDKDLYEHCFGKRPEGNIEVIKRPMILHFGFGNRNDFLWAYNFDETNGDEEKYKKVGVQRALKSGGVALSNLKEGELSGAVTLEPAYVLIPSYGPKENEALIDKNLELYVNALCSDISISVPGVNTWKIKIVERNKLGDPVRLQFWDSEESIKPVFDYRITVNPVSPTYFYLEDVTGVETRKLVNEIKYLKNGKDSYGFIDIDGSSIKLVSYSRGDIKVKYVANEYYATETGEVMLNKEVLDHEEQHQFNKLFVPIIYEDYFEGIMVRAIGMGNEDTKTAKDTLLRELTRFYRRQIGIDLRARDEIIAYYRDGRKPDIICEILTTDELYNYREQYKDEIDKMPDNISKKVKDEMSQVYYDVSEDGSYLVDAVPLEIDSEETKPYIDAVFGDEYKQDVKKWTNAVKVLEDKGYLREEIVSLLFQEPVNSWPYLVKRLPKKIPNL